MTAIVSPRQWSAVRAAYEAAGQRFLDLAAASPPDVMATEHWSVADTVAHLMTLSRMAVEVARRQQSRSGLIAATTVDTVAALNDSLMRDFPQRDVPGLLKQIRADMDELLQATADATPTDTVAWLGGSRLSIAAVHAHMMNEFHIHGRDVARATRTPLVVPPEEAVLFFDLFMIGIVRTGYGILLENGIPAPKGRVAVQFRSRYSQPVTMVVTDGVVSIEDPGTDVDVKVRFNPPVLNQIMFGRVTKVRGALTGKIRVSGRRPWLLLPFLRYVHMPS
ncbi:MAG: hypothetical protein HOV77_21510 [Hamadaea sp.]|uniref:maleylpyruvate isomerase N-terminal domain-containing protein n=1 Tax=Hamadaea sp. TaxID=2024425 RepID=UPI00181E9C65|nr:maleylpyruvate isomerase N-terminal domain-containing protein [Hamadaea sp.]NUT21762.1 hypothetical protein [Hamadaea sp.]